MTCTDQHQRVGRSLIGLSKAHSEGSTKRMARHHPVAELRFGADAKGSRRLHGLIDTFTASVAVLPVNRTAADRFGRVAAALPKRGEPIGTFDTLIAAHALALGVTLVTNNARHFRRVAGLKTANWV